MIGGKAQGSQRPTAMGTMLQASTYGMAIPTIYGMTQSPLLAIWAANLRMGSGSTKKLKQFFKKQPVYVEGVDFLVGANPIMGINQLWINGATIPLQIKTATFSTLSFASGTFTIDDADFYSIIGVTFANPYSETFDDYGSPGPASYSGIAQVPLWNIFENGPDPTNPNPWRSYPWLYRWLPSYGNVFYIDEIPMGFPILGSSTVTVTYFALKAATSFQSPLAKYRLAFENELGNGDEYSENNASAQQIIYPMFAGVGSPDIDLGTGATMPQIQAEVKGKFGYWPSGDADFADMIEDIFKSGIAQAAIGASTTGTSFTPLEHGLSGYAFPGCVQKQLFNSITAGPGSRSYNLPNTPGNFLVVVGISFLASTVSIADSAGNTWTPVFASGLGLQVWYAQAVGGANTVTISGLSNDWTVVLLEIAGVDTFDAAAVGSGGSATIATGNASGFPDYVIGMWLDNLGGTFPTDFSTARWSPLVNNLSVQLFERRTSFPATLPFQVSHTPAGMCLLSFKCVNPPSNPAPIGDFLDLPSLNLVRAQCRANGLYGSLTMISQQAASEWLKTLYQAANAAPVFLGSKLFSFPYSEVSAVGNGAVYNAPTASGPVADLDADNGDFVGKDPPIKPTTASRVDLPNVLQMQCISRTSNYNPIVVSEPDAASIALYGVRKADAVVNNAVQDASIARTLLGIAVRNNQYGADRYAFTLSARWSLLRPMNLVTVTDRLAGIVKFPVMLTSVAEQPDGSFACQAKPFVYGMNAPLPLPVSVQPLSVSNVNAGAGNVNPPLIFEPVPDLYSNLPGFQLWVVVSSGSPNYGGCQVFISTDGGASYNPAGDPLIGSAITGETTADWPAATDPDTTNDLPVDLTECNGTLASYSTTDENNFLYPCYVQASTVSVENNGALVADGGTPPALPLAVLSNGTTKASGVIFQSSGTTVAEPGPADFNYELMTYAIALLTAPNKYTLKATGSGNSLRRAVMDAPDSTGNGVDHAQGSRFAFLSPAGTGILKLNMPPQYVGQTIFFKIVSFNAFGGAVQSMTDVPAYSYTPTGVPGSV